MAVSVPPPPAYTPPEPPHKPPEPPKPDNFENWKRLPRWARWGLIALSVLVVIGGIGSITGSGNKSAKTTSSQPAQTAPAQSTPTQTVTPQTTITLTNAHATVRGPHAVLSGTTTPGAIVQVDQQPVTVDPNGNWRARVNVKMGDNNFVLMASAPGHADGFATGTVTRVMTPAEKAAAAAAAAKRAAAEKAAAAAAAARRAAAAKQRAAAERQGFINSAKTIPYNQLNKDAESYAGQKVAYHGQIFQIQESGGQGVMLLSVTDEGYGFWTDHIWVNYNHHVNGAENDMVTVYGTVVGTRSYDTQAGGTTYVPEIDAKYIVEGG